MRKNYRFYRLNGTKTSNFAAKAADLYRSVPIRNEVAKIFIHKDQLNL